MGTRGAWGFVLAGQEKIMYNHYDSYPDGLGQQLLDWLRGALGLPSTVEERLIALDKGEKPTVDPAKETKLRQRVMALSAVPDREPTYAEQVKYEAYSDADVSTGRDWYSVLRHTQGDPAKVLEAGLYEPNLDFPLDSLFCEWGYVIDLDMRQFEVYEGFRTRPTTAGRWAGRSPGSRAPLGETYFPIELVASYGFDELPELDLEVALQGKVQQ